MKANVCAAILVLLASIDCVSALWPIPNPTYTHSNQTLWLPQAIDIKFVAPPASNATARNVQYHNEYTSQPPYITRSRERVARAIDRTKLHLYNDKFVPWKLYPRAASFSPEFSSSSKLVQSITATQHLEDPDITTGTDTPIDESYNLTMSTDGKIKIDAWTSIGILHGLTTLTQLFYYTPPTGYNGGTGIYSNMAPVDIVDKPKFTHRGLNLDVARAWYPKVDLLRTLTAMSWSKLNILHLHAADAQSWPIFIPTMPDLAINGAFAPGLYYTVEDLSEIQNYADDLGIQLVIEIDMPGHTSAIANTYPDLIAANNVQPNWQDYSAEPPSGQLRLNYEPVNKFVTALLKDLLPRLKSEGGLWFHTGGDEVNKNVYNLDPTTNSNETDKIHPGLQKFIDNAHAEVRKQGFTPIVWEEMLLDWNLTLPKDVIVQSWISADSVANITAKGHRVVAGAYSYWYLDCGHGFWLDPTGNQVDVLGARAFVDYCNPIKNWKYIYSYDPLASIPASQQHLVIGGEVHQWSELADPVVLDSLLWPRVASAAEVLWSYKLPDGGNRTYPDVSKRLFEQRERMVGRGIGADTVQMVWCKQNDAGCEYGPGTGGGI